MNFGAVLLLSLILPIFFLIIYIMVRTLIRKEIPDSRFTPFDTIMGQTPTEYHEHKEEKEDEGEQGDDKNKNL
jgi:hypothetical protein